MIREHLRGRFFAFLRRVLATDDARESLFALIEEHNGGMLGTELGKLDATALPYADLGRGAAASCAAPLNGPVFISGRFRSGSTLVWNLFRHVPGVTSYYEPFNERRWFDPAARGDQVDQSHLGVTDYWVEYDGLAELGRFFDPQWKFRNLYMSSAAWNLPMQRYIETMMARARGRAVLQFNEVDFRLGWLRARFPTVPILHVYRHPRDQWCSTLLGAARSAAQCRLREFAPLDGFYLMSWARDLRHTFPFLTLAEDAFVYELFFSDLAPVLSTGPPACERIARLRGSGRGSGHRYSRADVGRRDAAGADRAARSVGQARAGRQVARVRERRVVRGHRVARRC